MAILSAKYGLLLPDDEIEPYNLTLNDMSSEEVRDWAQADNSQGQPDATRLERARVFAKETIKEFKN